MAEPLFTKKYSVLNLNVGVLGHIDSGKTSLAKCLSTIGSTAAFDKNPQSRERGITIDLGFSSFSVAIPAHLKPLITDHPLYSTVESLQYTLVDCPGHASLIKTIIGGAQIIDMMMLVVDITKGIQTQTAECLVIGEITCDNMIIVLNKIDLIDADKRNATIERMSKRIRKTLENSKFVSSPIVAVSAKSEGNDKCDNSIAPLLDALCNASFIPNRRSDDDFLLSVDHCFLIKGQGTVMTGTVLQGSVAVNDNIEVPSLKCKKKVKSIQMFRNSIARASQGDRVGICVTQFDSNQMERGVICSPGFMSHAYAAIASVTRVAYFKGSCETKAKFHISVMHETVLAKTTFFVGSLDNGDTSFGFDSQYSYENEMTDENSKRNKCYVLMEFERPVIVNGGALYIGSKLDSDIHANVCRLAFYGHILYLFNDRNYCDNQLPNLKIYKIKSKEGTVERIVNEYETIVKNLLKKETNIQPFVGLRVTLSTGETGTIEGNFGQSGKVKVRIASGLENAKISRSKRDSENNLNVEPIKVTLQFKRFIYDKNKKMIQN